MDDVADTPEVLWTRRAREDVRDIYRWTFTHFGRRQADLWAEALTRATDIIRRQPDIGARAPFPPGYRRFPLHSHVIYYRRLPAGSQIVRILHGSRDAGQHLGGPPSEEA
ncbi:type II toxin-antitoxin system RelE/ParE family toxin [Tistrella sp.]|uniref:type II toxin-antitoxin system RelE/ParE family toxin n=1 Tax=Tistrella sp. TaxID=2024861 RepID=UPI003A5C74D0